MPAAAAKTVTRPLAFLFGAVAAAILAVAGLWLVQQFNRLAVRGQEIGATAAIGAAAASALQDGDIDRTWFTEHDGRLLLVEPRYSDAFPILTTHNNLDMPSRIDSPDSIVDYWGAAYRIEILGDSTDRVRVTSSGPDRRFDTDDDITRD